VPTDVYVEAGRKRAFASAIAWPGWSRSGRDEAAALVALAEAAPRYAAVVAEAGYTLVPEDTHFRIVERVEGNGTTDFGAPDRPSSRDGDTGPAQDWERLASLVEASWAALDRVAARAPAELAKGPRGGGRDRDKVLQHVLGAEANYARKIGIRRRAPALVDTEAVRALRDAITATLRTGVPAEDVRNPWLLPYAARRIAWHVLDHAWEIEDRGGLEPERAW